MEKIRVGIIGVGGIARMIHIPGYQKSQDSIITAICDTDDETLAKAAKLYNIPEKRCFKDYRDIIACDEVDAVDICTPNYLHCRIANEAIAHGKPFSVEKPVGMDYKETLDLYENAKRSNVPAVVCFSWRYRPYVRYMKNIVDSGEIGDLYHVYIRCIKNSGLIPGRKLEWRFDKDLAATGVLGDLSSHMFDITRFLGEEFKSVVADMGILVKERQRINSDEIGEVTTDDWCNILAKMESGTNITYQISRCATTIDDWIQVELYGKNGILLYKYWNGDQTIEIDVKKSGRQTLVPPPEFQAEQSQAFIDHINGKNDGLTALLEDGVKCQSVLDAALKSHETGRWVDIFEITQQGEK